MRNFFYATLDPKNRCCKFLTQNCIFSLSLSRSSGHLKRVLFFISFKVPHQTKRHLKPRKPFLNMFECILVIERERSNQARIILDTSTTLKLRLIFSEHQRYRKLTRGICSVSGNLKSCLQILRFCHNIFRNNRSFSKMTRQLPKMTEVFRSFWKVIP